MSNNEYVGEKQKLSAMYRDCWLMADPTLVDNKHINTLQSKHLGKKQTHTTQLTTEDKHTEWRINKMYCMPLPNATHKIYSIEQIRKHYTAVKCNIAAAYGGV